MNIIYSQPTSAEGSRVHQLLNDSKLTFATMLKDSDREPEVSCSCRTYSWKGLSDILDFIRIHKEMNKQN